MMKPTDDNLDDLTMTALYDSHASRVFRVVYAIVRSVSDAEEIVQDVFLQAWLQRDRYDPSRGSPEAWILTLARSRSIDCLRARRARRGGHPDSSVDHDSIPAPAVFERETTYTLHNAVEALPVYQRLAVQLAFHEGYTHDEIARLLRQPLGTVKTRIRLALLKIRDGIEHGTSRTRAHREKPFVRTLTEFLRCAPSVSHSFDRLEGVRVLVVDDDHESGDLIATVLESAGAVTDQARSANAAEAQLSITWPDVMVADIMMPAIDGYELMQRTRIMARRRGRSFRAAAFTALGGSEDRAAALLAGFDVHVAKPADPQTIVHTVAQLANR